MGIPKKIFRLSEEAILVISEIREEDLPEELEESLKTSELLLRGYLKAPTNKTRLM